VGTRLSQWIQPNEEYDGTVELMMMMIVMVVIVIDMVMIVIDMVMIMIDFWTAYSVQQKPTTSKNSLLFI